LGTKKPIIDTIKNIKIEDNMKRIEQEFINKIYDGFKKIDVTIPESLRNTSIRKICNYISTLEVEIFDLQDRKDKKKICAFEASLGHDIICPSINEYFEKLGYEVDFLLSEENNTHRWSFFGLTKSSNYRIITGEFPFLSALLLTKTIRQYDFVVFSTNIKFYGNFYRGSVIKFFMEILRNIPKPKYTFLQIAPHFPKNTIELDIFNKTHKIDGITTFSSSGYNGSLIFSTHSLGNAEITQKSQKTKFITTGNFSDRKNHKMLYEAIAKLVNEGITDFEVYVNSMPHGAFYPDESLMPYIKKSDPKPMKLFYDWQECDFALALLDSSHQWSRDYFGQGTFSGGAMLALDFAKPYILENYFSKSFGFDDKMALLYERQDLYKAMKIAINMTVEEYSKYQQAMKTEADKRYNETLYNLSNEINKAAKDSYKDIWRKYRYKIFPKPIILFISHFIPSKSMKYKFRDKFLKWSRLQKYND
jgi:hypothetical protein